MLYMVTNNKMYSGVYKNLKNKIFQPTQAKVNILLELIYQSCILRILIPSAKTISPQTGEKFTLVIKILNKAHKHESYMKLSMKSHKKQVLYIPLSKL